MKLERERVVDFEFKSRMKDIGLFRASFKFKRMTDGYFAQIANLKAIMTGGAKLTDEYDIGYLNVLAHLQVLCEPILPAGTKPSDTWLEDILDSRLKFALFEKLMEYQSSFYETEGEDESPV